MGDTMQFAEHYFQEKITSDIRRAFTSNLFKKRKTGVDLGRGKFKEVIPAESRTFSKIKEGIRQEVMKVAKSSHKDDPKKFKKLFGKVYVNSVLEGEIDSGSENLEGEPVATTVYELNNGGQIAFITTEDDDGSIRKYIATNVKGNDFFKEKAGTTLQQIAADAKKSRTLVTRERIVSPRKEIDQLIKSLEPTEEQPIESPEDEYSKELGIMDISVDDFESLKKIWGTGRIGGIVKGSVYPFKNMFSRSRYFNNDLNYNGYKYSDGRGHEVYLIDTSDGQNAFIAFQNKDSLNWATRNDMLSYWKSKPGELEVKWREGTIENLQ